MPSHTDSSYLSLTYFNANIRAPTQRRETQLVRTGGNIRPKRLSQHRKKVISETTANFSPTRTLPQQAHPSETLSTLTLTMAASSSASSSTTTTKDNLLFPPPSPSVISAPQTLPNASLESASIQSIITSLSLTAFVEGGYMAETDRNTLEIPSPFPLYPATTFSNTAPTADPNYEFDPNSYYRPGFDPKLRNASTTIYYLLTGTNGGKVGKEGPGGSPKGYLHRNRGRIIHTLHRGRGRYVILHADETPCRVESFVVGKNVKKGEKVQWIVEGGKYKGTFVLPVEDGEDDDEMIFISETTVPGWEVFDHDFLDRKGLEMLMEGDAEKIRQLEWLVKEEE